MATALIFLEHPSAQSQIQIIKDSLAKGWEYKVLPTLPSESPEWMEWLLLQHEQQMKERYANLQITLEKESTTVRGLFHEWQIRPLMTTINESNNNNLIIKGVGRVYTSMWTGTNIDFKETSSTDLTVQR